VRKDTRQLTSRSFKPAKSENIQIEFVWQERIAHAMEYIAAQLGEINERLASDEQRRVEKRTARNQKKVQKRAKDQTEKLQAHYGKLAE
jgi:hypothetical protein